jgi:hypothetical protein
MRNSPVTTKKRALLLALVYTLLAFVAHATAKQETSPSVQEAPEPREVAVS